MKSFHAEVGVCVCEQKEYHNDYEHSKWKYTPVADSADMQHHVQNKKIVSMVPSVTDPCPVFRVVSSLSQRDCHLEKINVFLHWTIHFWLAKSHYDCEFVSCHFIMTKSHVCELVSCYYDDQMSL